MRPIEFRAWDKINSKWVSVGDLDEEIIINPFTSTSRAGQFSISEWNTVHHVAEDIGTTIILMQYTGLKDENGLKIHEGDVVEAVGTEVVKVTDSYRKIEAGIYNFVVFWDESFAGWGFKHPIGSIHTNIGIREYKIVGNIHENPDLIGE